MAFNHMPSNKNKGVKAKYRRNIHMPSNKMKGVFCLCLTLTIGQTYDSTSLSFLRMSTAISSVLVGVWFVL